MMPELVDLIALFVGYLALLLLAIALGCLAYWSIQNSVRSRRYRADR